MLPVAKLVVDIPVGQEVQEDDPTFVEYVPVAQIVHAVSPDDDHELSTAFLVHTRVDEPEYPTLQGG